MHVYNCVHAFLTAGVPLLESASICLCGRAGARLSLLLHTPDSSLSSASATVDLHSQDKHKTKKQNKKSQKTWIAEGIPWSVSSITLQKPSPLKMLDSDAMNTLPPAHPKLS